MPQYVLLANHPPDTCPTANARTRARAIEGMTQLLPKLAPKAGVTFQAGPLHLDPGHRMVAVLDAPSIEVVTKFVFDIGLSQWNEVEICPATPTADRMAAMDGFSALYD
ncbi:MAG TPA: hypothetical protein VKU86_15260 [Acidimicrobiales bacterium]|nr:hypothetical protein [Acidimicrobiales bacterium]